MSMSLQIKGTYKNNKKNIIGTHCSQNRIVFTIEESKHLKDMFKKYFESNLDKFKKVEVKAWCDGHEILNSKVDINCLKNEPFTTLNQIVRHIEDLSYDYINREE
jgi:hypothetical protein